MIANWKTRVENIAKSHLPRALYVSEHHVYVLTLHDIIRFPPEHRMKSPLFGMKSSIFHVRMSSLCTGFWRTQREKNRSTPRPRGVLEIRSECAPSCRVERFHGWLTKSGLLCERHRFHWFPLRECIRAYEEWKYPTGASSGCLPLLLGPNRIE